MDIRSSVQAIKNFNPHIDRYLAVEHDNLCVVQPKGFMGYLWMWVSMKMGWSNASLPKVAAFIKENKALLESQLSNREKNKLNRIFSHYARNHPKYQTLMPHFEITKKSLREINSSVTQGQTTLQLKEGDLFRQKFEQRKKVALVNAANPSLLSGGGGVNAQFTHRAAPGFFDKVEVSDPFDEAQQNSFDSNQQQGRKVNKKGYLVDDKGKEIRTNGYFSTRCPPGEAVISGPGKLRDVAHIIHAVGPDYRVYEDEEETLLKSTYKRVFEIADENGIEALALPSISTGIYSYPPDKAGRALYQAFQEFMKEHPQTTLKDIRVVFYIPDEYEREDYQPFLTTFESLVRA